MANFLKDFSLTGLSTLIVTVIAFFNNIIVTRQIGPDGRGKYSIISNSVLLLALLAGEGIRKSNTILVNKVKNVNTLITQSLIYILILTVLSIILYLFRESWRMLLPNINNQLLIFTFIIAVLTISWQSIQALFLGLQKIYQYNILLSAPIIITFVLNLFVILILNSGLTAIIINMLIGALITAAIGITLFNFKFSLDFSDKKIRKQSLSLMLKSTFAAFQLFLILRADIFLVNFFIGASWAGIYSIAFFFSEALQKISNVSGTLLISKTVSDETDVSALYTAKLIRVILFISFIFVLIVGFIGKYLIILFFGKDFAPAYSALLFLLPALLSFGPGSIPYSFFVSKSYPIPILIITGIAGLSNIFLNIIFIPRYGINAAALISSVTYLFWAVAHIIYFKRKCNYTYSDLLFIKKNDLKYLLYYLSAKNRNG